MGIKVEPRSPKRAAKKEYRSPPPGPLLKKFNAWLKTEEAKETKTKKPFMGQMASPKKTKPKKKPSGTLGLSTINLWPYETKKK